MDVSRRRAGVKTSVVAGSVWESRMKLDEVKGGIKVFNGDGNNEETVDSSRKLVKRGQSGTAKRKTWKSESFDGPIQIAKGKTEPSPIKNCEEQCRELSVSADGIKKISIPARRGRSDGIKELSVSLDEIDKTPIQGKKGRSDVNTDGNEKSPVQIRKPRSDTREFAESGAQFRKSKSDSEHAANQSGNIELDSGRDSIPMRKAKSEPEKALEDESEFKGSDDSVNRIEKSPPEIEEAGSEESCKEVISSSEAHGALIKSPPILLVDNQDDNNDEATDGDEALEGDEEVEIEIEKKSLEVKEIKIPEEKTKKVETKASPEQKPKKLVNEDKRVYQFRNRTAPTSSTVNKQPPPVLRRATIYQNLSKPTPTPLSNGNHQNFPETHNKLQNLVDLVMWRDISRSAFVFGIGTFIIISSSYTKDLNVSFISVISYLGLVYLAAIFLYRSLICRGVIIYIEDRSHVVGEEEAIWLLKLVLPYLNECLLKIKALFSGDPATTMKLAVLLFVFARCGSSITIWNMAKLAKFWIRRFRDAWDSCSHKKAVALAIFTLVWNLSSMIARVWAVFMMFVAVRYYQQSMEAYDWDEDENDETIDIGEQSRKIESTSGEINKIKKKL
ncbi:reticulon-like protein B21 isoform X2 [Manihot esculenta]|uniref:reticulon-like protein B21 isoform X2 n=1 Tax=Manihot esculenta TaxID=3983 RepID=UPI001CC7DCC8|nr:reticulon-like protein B21 isoform X2 [Manihot esculenta]